MMRWGLSVSIRVGGCLSATMEGGAIRCRHPPATMEAKGPREAEGGQRSEGPREAGGGQRSEGPREAEGGQRSEGGSTQGEASEAARREAAAARARSAATEHARRPTDRDAESSRAAARAHPERRARPRRLRHPSGGPDPAEATTFLGPPPPAAPLTADR